MGQSGDIAIAGDWNGDGRDTVGVFRPSNGTFYLSNSNDQGYAEIAFAYGLSSDKPIAGDWNNDGIDTIGVFRPSTGQFLLRNTNSAGYADLAFVFGGLPGDSVRQRSMTLPNCRPKVSCDGHIIAAWNAIALSPK